MSEMIWSSTAGKPWPFHVFRMNSSAVCPSAQTWLANEHDRARHAEYPMPAARKPQDQ